MIQTAQTQTGDAIPTGTGVEEFLRDADLPAFFERELAACDPTDEERRVGLINRLRAARKAAKFTEIALLDAEEYL